MRFDRATIQLEPLSPSNCIDFAVLFIARGFRPILSLVLGFAIPLCGAVYYLVYEQLYDVRLAVLVYFFATSPLGVLLTSGAAMAAFGEEFEWRTLWKKYYGPMIQLLFNGLLARIGIGAVLLMFVLESWPLWVRVPLGLLLCFFPGLYLTIRTGFLAERGILSHLSHHLSDTRGHILIKRRSLELIGRGGILFVFCGLIWLTFMLSLDLAVTFLFDFPLFFTRMGPAGDFNSLIMDDPRAIVLMLFSAFLVYPFGRLAWFFCYIDLRVRYDCWDMELEMIREAEQLEAIT